MQNEMTEPALDPVQTPPKRENILLALVLNVALPTLILSKLSGERWLGPGWGLGLALAAPAGYFVYDYAVRRRANFISIIGLTSVAATGGLGLLKAGGAWFAVKEAAVPLIVGLGVLFSTRSKRPLVRQLLFNEDLIDVAKVMAGLEERGRRGDFERLLLRSSQLLAVGFVASAALNFVLVRTILKAAPGSTAFNAELGRVNLLSWPVVVVPTLGVSVFALWRVLRGASRMSGLSMDEVFRAEPSKDGRKGGGSTGGPGGLEDAKLEAAAQAAPSDGETEELT